MVAALDPTNYKELHPVSRDQMILAFGSQRRPTQSDIIRSSRSSTNDATTMDVLTERTSVQCPMRIENERNNSS